MSLNIISLISVSVVAVSAQGGAPEIAVLPKPVSPPSNAGGCALHKTHQNVKVECTIPSSTGMNTECCKTVQGVLDGTAQPQGPAAPKECQDFDKYMKSFQSPPPDAGGEKREEVAMEGTFMDDVSKLPSGLSCTETILPESDTVCDINVAVAQVDVTCKLPASTKMNPECCKKVKEQIASKGKAYSGEPPECKDFGNYVKKLAGPLQNNMDNLPPPSDKGPSEEEMMKEAAGQSAMQILPNLPGGLSCTELITGGGTSLSASREVISAIGLVRAKSEQRIAHDDLAIYGVTSFLVVGMLVGGALYINSKNNRKQQLLLA